MTSTPSRRLSPRRCRRPVVVAFGLASALASLVVAATPPAGVEVLVPDPREHYTLMRAFPGTVEAPRAAALAFDTGGRIARIDVDEGDAVAPGQPVAALETERLVARRAELTAALTEARATLALATATLDRLETALSYEGTSRQALDEAEQRRDAARSAVARLEAERATLEVGIGKATVTAPFAGVVAARHVDEGAVVGAGTPIVDVLERGPAKARIGVPARSARALGVGDRVRVDVEGRGVPSTVARIAPRVNPADRTVDVVLALGDADVTPGELAVVELPHKREVPGFWLPVAALMSGLRGAWQVYEVAPDPNGAEGALRIVPHAARLIAEDGERVYVQADIRPDTRLVAGGRHRVVPGQQVRVVGTVTPRRGNGTTP